MIVAHVKCEYVKVSVAVKKKITAGMIGAQIMVTFNEDWDALAKTAVFRCGNVTKDVLNVGTVIDIPWEVLAEPENWLEVSFYGANGDGSFALPSLWANLGMVRDASDPMGDPGADPTLPPWVGILEEMEEFRLLNDSVKQNTADISEGKAAIQNLDTALEKQQGTLEEYGATLAEHQQAIEDHNAALKNQQETIERQGEQIEANKQGVEDLSAAFDTIPKLPEATAENDGYFLQSKSGAWVPADPEPIITETVNSIIDAKFVPMTQAEYDALAAAGNTDPDVYYMIVGDAT